MLRIKRIIVAALGIEQPRDQRVGGSELAYAKAGDNGESSLALESPDKTVESVGRPASQALAIGEAIAKFYIIQEVE